MDTSITFASLISTLQTLVNTIMLPIAIVIAGWRIVYLVVFPGLIGADPLNMVKDQYTSQWGTVWVLVRQQLGGFFRGLLWIGGIWILFNFVIAVVSLMANTLGDIL